MVEWGFIITKIISSMLKGDSKEGLLKDSVENVNTSEIDDDKNEKKTKSKIGK